MYRFYTEAECDLLLAEEPLPLEEIAQRTGRTTSSLTSRLRRMRRRGVGFGRPWSLEEEQRLAELLQNGTVAEAARGLGRSDWAVRCRMKLLGLHPRDFHVRAKGKLVRTRFWIRKEVLSLYRWAGQITYIEAGRRLGRTAGAIENKCRNLGIQWSRGSVESATLARTLGVDKATVLRWTREKDIGTPGSYRRLFSEDDVDEVLAHGRAVKEARSFMAQYKGCRMSRSQRGILQQAWTVADVFPYPSVVSALPSVPCNARECLGGLTSRRPGACSLLLGSCSTGTQLIVEML